MKKTALFSIIAIFIVSIISGCGSNTKADPIFVSLYKFINASTPMDINKSDTNYTISVQLIEGEFGFPGQTVRMRPFDNTFGTLEESNVETDDSGWAYFKYRSPTNIADLIGQTALLQAVYLNDDNETEAVQDFILSFSAQAAETIYKMTNQSTPIIVDSNSSVQTIFVYIVDDQNTGVEGETVITSILDQRFGSISPSSVKTDDAGKASFTYTGPVDITPVIGQQTSITLRYVKGGNTSTVRVDIQIVAPQI